jgi:hypothetical protein
MKKLITNPIAIIIILFAFGYFYLINSGMKVSSKFDGSTKSIRLPESDTAFGGIFFEPKINDSLPHYEYKRLKDSFEKAKKSIELKNRSALANSLMFGFIGAASFSNFDYSNYINESNNDRLTKLMMDSIRSIGEEFPYTKDSLELNKKKRLICDISNRLNIRINNINDSIEVSSSKKYYLTLEGYQVNMESHFFIKDDTYNLAYVIWDSVRKYTAHSVTDGHYEQKRVSVRYSKEDEKVFVPLSSVQYTLISTAILLAQWLSIAISLYFILGLPIQILIRISKGNAFSAINVKSLRLIAFFCFVYALTGSLSPHLFSFAFKSVIPDDFKLPPIIYYFYQYLSYFFSAVMIFMLSIAFKKGHKLQQEQNLII